MRDAQMFPTEFIRWKQGSVTKGDSHSPTLPAEFSSVVSRFRDFRVNLVVDPGSHRNKFGGEHFYPAWPIVTDPHFHRNKFGGE